MKRRSAIILAVIGMVLFCGYLRVSLYSDQNDYKNVRYVLWKAGFARMNLDTAVGTMSGDPNRDRLVIGKTKKQLEEKFGYLLTSAEASTYLGSCYQTSVWKNRDVMFLRSAPWMVVFEGDKASNLILIKGC